jgi:hypothetical protein
MIARCGNYRLPHAGNSNRSFMPIKPTITIVSAEPGFRVASFIVGAPVDLVPCFSFAPVLAWAVTTTIHHDDNGDAMTEAIAEPVTTGSTLFQRDAVLLACPDGRFHDWRGGITYASEAEALAELALRAAEEACGHEAKMTDAIRPPIPGPPFVFEGNITKEESS